MIGDSWHLRIFGNNIEDTFGHFGFLIFYMMAGIGAGVVHTIFNSFVRIPAVGASGAIAGVLGAYMLQYPFARVLTLIPILFFWKIVEIPPLLVLGIWFLIQLMSGTGALAINTLQPAELLGGLILVGLCLEYA